MKKNVTFAVSSDDAPKLHPDEDEDEEVVVDEEDEDEEAEEEEEDGVNDDTEYQRMIRELGLMDAAGVSTVVDGSGEHNHHDFSSSSSSSHHHAQLDDHDLHHHHHHNIHGHHHHHHSSLLDVGHDDSNSGHAAIHNNNINDEDEEDDDLDDLDFILDEIENRNHSESESMSGRSPGRNHNNNKRTAKRNKRKGRRRTRGEMEKSANDNGVGVGELGSPLFRLGIGEEDVGGEFSNGSNDPTRDAEDGDDNDEGEDDEEDVDDDDDDDDDDEDDDEASFFVGDIEDELGDLLNEDLDAAIHSLTRDGAGAGGFSSSAIMPPIGGVGGVGMIDTAGIWKSDDLMMVNDDDNNVLPLDPQAYHQIFNGTTQTNTTNFTSTGQSEPEMVTAASLAAAAEAAKASSVSATLASSSSPSTKSHTDPSGEKGSSEEETAEQKAISEAEAKKAKAVAEAAAAEAAKKAAAQEKQRRLEEQKARTEAQAKLYQSLLKQHYQLLVQQAVLSVRGSAIARSKGQSPSSHTSFKASPSGVTESNNKQQDSNAYNVDKKNGSNDADGDSMPTEIIKNGTEDDQNFFGSQIVQEELALGLDSAVSMMQDLDVHRRDAIRTSTIYDLRQSSPSSSEGQDDDDDDDVEDETDEKPAKGRRSLMSDLAAAQEQGDDLDEHNEQKETEHDHDHPRQGNRHDDSQMSWDDPNRRLTRAAFQRLQAQPYVGTKRRTAFDVPGLWNVHKVFEILDEGRNYYANGLDYASLTETLARIQPEDMCEEKPSMTDSTIPLPRKPFRPKQMVGELYETTETIPATTETSNNMSQTAQSPSGSSTMKAASTTTDPMNINCLEKTVEVVTDTESPGRKSLPLQSNVICRALTHKEACQQVLEKTEVECNKSLLPGSCELTESFASPEEVLSMKDDTLPEDYSLSADQKADLRRSRNLFTTSEDNLVMKGVNLYGEKQWELVAERYLPDRPLNSISQRYGKLCYMIYKAQGIEIDEKGNFAEPPKYVSVDEIDQARLEAANLKKIPMPQVLNVHRWSLDEDLTILKAVPIMGNMWAELSARYIPHRDRGHLRKRYQVLERRVKATVSRIRKLEKAMEEKRAKKEAAIQKKMSKITAKSRKAKAVKKGPKSPVAKKAKVPRSPQCPNNVSSSLDKVAKSTEKLDQGQKTPSARTFGENSPSMNTSGSVKTGNMEALAKSTKQTTDAGKQPSSETVSKDDQLVSTVSNKKDTYGGMKPSPGNEISQKNSQSVESVSSKVSDQPDKPPSSPASQHKRSAKVGGKSSSVGSNHAEDLMSVEKAAASLAFMNQQHGKSLQETSGGNSDENNRAQNSSTPPIRNLSQATRHTGRPVKATITGIPVPSHVKLAVPDSHAAGNKCVGLVETLSNNHNDMPTTAQPSIDSHTQNVVNSEALLNSDPKTRVWNDKSQYESIATERSKERDSYSTSTAADTTHVDSANTVPNPAIADPSKLHETSELMHSRDTMLENGTDDSRLAVERLIQEYGDEWSHLMSAKGGVGSGNGSSRAFPFSKQHSPRRTTDHTGEFSKFCVDPYDINNDISGLSVLKDVKKSSKRERDDGLPLDGKTSGSKDMSGNRSHDKPKMSIFGRVVGSNGGARTSSSSSPDVTTKKDSSQTSLPSVDDCDEGEEKKDVTPRKSSLLHEPTFESPMKMPGAFFSTTGTPSRIAPSMNAFGDSPDGPQANPMTEGNSLLRDMELADSTNGTFGNESLLFAGNPLPIDEASRQEAQLEKTLGHASMGYAVRRALAGPMSPQGKSMAGGSPATADDLAAISALEALSNSPFRRTGNPNGDIFADKETVPKSDGQTNNNSKSTIAADKRATGKSLFAKVVGKVNSKKKDGSGSGSSSSSTTRKSRKRGYSDESPKKRLKF